MTISLDKRLKRSIMNNRESETGCQLAHRFGTSQGRDAARRRPCLLL